MFDGLGYVLAGVLCVGVWSGVQLGAPLPPFVWRDIQGWIHPTSYYIPLVQTFIILKKISFFIYTIKIVGFQSDLRVI